MLASNKDDNKDFYEPLYEKYATMITEVNNKILPGKDKVEIWVATLTYITGHKWKEGRLLLRDILGGTQGPQGRPTGNGCHLYYHTRLLKNSGRKQEGPKAELGKKNTQGLFFKPHKGSSDSTASIWTTTIKCTLLGGQS